MEIINLPKDPLTVVGQYLCKYDLLILDVAAGNAQLVNINSNIICYWIRNGYINLLKKYNGAIDWRHLLCVKNGVYHTSSTYAASYGQVEILK